MVLRLIKLGISFAFLIFLGYIFYATTPPKTWEQASVVQILSVFLPILLAATFLVDVFLNYFPHSFLIGLGIVVIVLLQAVGQLNILTGCIVILITLVLVRIFPKTKLLYLRKLFLRFKKIPKVHAH